DPEGYSDGMNLYAYVQGMALSAVDPMGLCSNPRTCHIQSHFERQRQITRKFSRNPEMRREPGPRPAEGPPPILGHRYKSSLDPTICAGGACNPNMSGSELEQQCNPIVRPYPPPSFPCNSQSRKDACFKWATQACDKRQGSRHNLACRAACISEAAVCCESRGCNKPGKANDCLDTGIRAMARCNWAPEQDMQACYAACWTVATAPCATV